MTNLVIFTANLFLLLFRPSLHTFSATKGDKPKKKKIKNQHISFSNSRKKNLTKQLSSFYLRK